MDHKTLNWGLALALMFVAGMIIGAYIARIDASNACERLQACKIIAQDYTGQTERVYDLSGKIPELIRQDRQNATR
jgi:hypothetical protein